MLKGIRKRVVTSMNQKFRALVHRIAVDTIRESVSVDGYEGEDLEATCKHCNQDIWLVWEKKAPAFKWTECGGIGAGSCTTRAPEDSAPPATLASALGGSDEPAPITVRSPSRSGESTKLKRSV